MFKVGGEVWFTQPLLHKGEGAVPGEVTKVGSKYIYVKGPKRIFKFDKNTLWEANESNYIGRLYRSKQEYLDIRELRKLYNSIRAHFIYPDTRGLTLTIEQLREIKAVITKENEND